MQFFENNSRQDVSFVTYVNYDFFGIQTKQWSLHHHLKENQMEKESGFSVRMEKGFFSFFIHAHEPPSLLEERETFFFVVMMDERLSLEEERVHSFVHVQKI